MLAHKQQDMRTTIRLDENLLADAKQYALETGRSLTAVIEEALREKLARSQRPPQRKRLRLPTFKGTGVAPGVNLDSNAELLDVMDGFLSLPDVNVLRRAGDPRGVTRA